MGNPENHLNLLTDFFFVSQKTFPVLRKSPKARISKMNCKPVVLLLAVVLLSAAEAKPNALERLMSDGDGDLVKALSKYVNEIEERLDGFGTKLNSSRSSLKSVKKRVTKLEDQPKFQCEWNYLRGPDGELTIYFQSSFTEPPTFLAAICQVSSDYIQVGHKQPTSTTSVVISAISTNGDICWMACGY